jgi:hypothetical protein
MVPSLKSRLHKNWALKKKGLPPSGLLLEAGRESQMKV